MNRGSSQAVDLFRDRDRYVAFAFAVAEAFLEVDSKRVIKYAGGAVHWLTGGDSADLLGVSVLDIIARPDRALVKAALATCVNQGRFGPVDIRVTWKNARLLRVALYGTHLGDHNGNIYLALRAQGVDLSAEATDDMARARKAGLLDMADFANVAGEALKAGRNLDQPYNMTLFNVEGLDRLRTRLDADIANEFLDDISAHLQVASVNCASAGRLDDERYGLVHDADLDIDALEQTIADQAKDLDPAGQGLNMAATTLDLEAGEMSEVESAKALLYTINKFSETRGDFTIRELSDGYKSMLDQTRQKMVALKDTIANGTFDIFFQPIVDLVTRAVHHYEALSRLREAGPQSSPHRFIAFAEEVDLIADFDLAVCRKVLDKIQAARDNGDVLDIAVNLSTRSLAKPTFVDALHALLDHRSVGEELLFEVTESWKIKDLESTNRILHTLRTRGHHICLDDFGAGSASFEYLRALDVDYVKIDGVYVREALTKPNGKAFLRSMANLCRDLDIQTVGEMIETEEVAAFLLEVGVRYGQGYLFGKPKLGMVSRERRLAS